MITRCLPLLLLTLLCTCVRAQKAITVQDMQAWNQIRGEQIGADGNFVLYSLNKDVGDPTVVLYNVAQKTETRFPRLHLARLSYDGKHLIGLLKPSLETVRGIKLKEKKKAKKKLAKMDSLLVWNLAEANPQIVPAVFSYKVSDRSPKIYAYTTETTLADSLRGGLDDDAHRLVVRSFVGQDSFYLEGVKSYIVARDAPVVLAHQMAKDSSWKEGVLLLDASQVFWKTISSDAGDYSGLALSHDGRSAAFMTADKEDKDAQKPYHLHYLKPGTSRAVNLTETPGNWLAAGQRLSDDRTPNFSDDANYLYFGTTPRRPERDTMLLDDEIADVEVWRTEDPRLYTQQNVQASQEKKRTFLAVYRTKTSDFLQLASQEMPYDYQTRTANGPWVAVYDDRPYAKQTTWEGRPGRRNTTIINLDTGDRQPMENGEVTPSRWLEDGKFLVWYNPRDTTWNSFDPATKTAHVLTTNATGTFYNETNDRPMNPRSYGYDGTLADGKGFLVSDRYDLWQLDPEGKQQPKRLTQGREKTVRYFLRQLDREDRLVDLSKPQLTSAFREETYQSGFGWMDLMSGDMDEIKVGEKSFAGFAKARLADRYLHTQSDFREYPDLWFADGAMAKGSKISTANPQQSDFAWGTAERYQWIDNQGRTLNGMLIKPDNFDPNKKYPMLVNFYERSSEGVFRHRTPVPGRSSINYSHYVSKGYVIFNPDVVYRVGYPGESAYDCVMSGITSLLSHGFIDKDNIGMQGHSWGGYQAAYLVTKTDMFAAVESGAPVVNMFSAYGGIRWGSGVSRQFQYEHTQSRIGGTPWTHFQRYYENSPIFTTDKINTPLLILHNDNDGAVPWYQSIEWFTALRRLGKPAWMLNYRGEPHWPVKTANRADFQTRMEQFFDYYLMDAPMPKWMDEGVSPMKRQKEQNLELMGDGE
jgi:dipeptidyl aminopeptidase/acylaminoacyl peptidase